MTVETPIEMKKLGITQEFLKVIVVNELPETATKGLFYIWNSHVWVYCKAPDEPIKRWHDLGSVSDFDDSEPLNEMESDIK